MFGWVLVRSGVVWMVHIPDPHQHLYFTQLSSLVMTVYCAGLFLVMLVSTNNR